MMSSLIVVWLSVADIAFLWTTFLQLLRASGERRYAQVPEDANVTAEIWDAVDSTLMHYKFTFASWVTRPAGAATARAQTSVEERELLAERPDEQRQAACRRAYEEMVLYDEQAVAFDAIREALDESTFVRESE